MSLQPIAKTQEALTRYLANNFRTLKQEIDSLRARVEELEKDSHVH